MTDSVLNRYFAYSTTTQIPFPVPPPAPLLDTYPNAAFAYSFRKLRTAYAGSAVRIRRSSDNVELDVGFSGNNFDTAAAAAHIGGGSGFIVTWYDQSGNSVNVTQGTAANQPLYSASGLKSLPTGQYDGTNDDLRKTPYSATVTQGTVFAVMIDNFSAGVTNSTILGYDVFATRINVSAAFSDSNIYWDLGNGGRVQVTIPSGWANNPHVLELFRDSSDNQGITVDGTNLVTNTITQDTAGNVDTLFVGSNGSQLLNGYLSELVMWFTDLGSAGRSGARTSINTYYGNIF